MCAMLQLPEYVVGAKAFDAPIRLLQLERQNYDNYPEYQREKVWTYPMKRSLIDSIQRGLPIPPLYALWKDHNYLIFDGQQRLSTIFEYLADGFATARVREDPALDPLEPNKRYSQLSQTAKNAINNYIVRIWVVEERNEPELAALFRRLQQQRPLSLAERLWTFRADFRHHVNELTAHPFWHANYIGRQAHKRVFLGCLYLLLLELDHGYTSITPSRLRDIATGTRDGSLKSELIPTLASRLDDMQHLFHRTLLMSMAEIIPLYQAVLFLEQYECDLKKSEQGCLTSWYNQCKETSLRARRTHDQIDLLAKILHSKYQIAFWSEELPKVLATKGLYRINKKRTFSAADRLKAWERQNGLCPVCRQPVKPTDQGHHIIHYKDGGPTSEDNCMLVHDECHRVLHTITGVEIEVIPIDD